MNNNAMPVAAAAGMNTAVPEGFEWNIYLLWDETYLYVAYEITDPSHGPLYYGADGDNAKLFFDFNNIGAENGNANMHSVGMGMFPVVDAADKTKATGVHSWVNPADGAPYDEGSPSENPLNNVGASISGNKWYGEQRVAWSTLRDNTIAQYGKDFEPKAGLSLSFMPSYHDCNEQNSWVGWYIGQNVGYVDEWGTEITWPAAIPTCYGFRGVLAEKKAVETGDFTSVAVAAIAISLAVVSVVYYKKH